MPAVYASTSPDWFKHISMLQPSPGLVAFWRPTDSAPKNILPGDYWFFKELGAPRLLGHGRFISRERSTVAELWKKYGVYTGAESLFHLKNSITSTQKTQNENIGCIVLSNFTKFSPAINLSQIDLPNLSTPYRYIPPKNKLLNILSETTKNYPHHETSAKNKKEITKEIFTRNTGHVAHIRRLYGGRCQVTGDFVFSNLTEDLTHIHHIDFLSNGGADDPSNMIALSPNWHAIAHAPGTIFDWNSLEFIIEGRRYGLSLNYHLMPRSEEYAEP